MVKSLKKRSTATAGPSPPSSATGSLTEAGRVATKVHGLKESQRLRVFEVPLAQLVEHSENPNEQSERTFDEIVERIKKGGFDEPIIVVPQVLNGQPTGKFLIVSGHHRKKAAQSLGYTSIPAIIREGWSQDRIDIELISRNQLRGNINPFKFTEIFDRLTKRYDKAQLQQMMGLTEKKAFNQLYKRISENLSPKQKRKLDEAKEKITSIEDLGNVLHNILKDHGSELDDGFMVFTYGGKKHHYIKIDDETHKRLEKIEAACIDADIDVQAFFKELISRTRGPESANVSKPVPPVPLPVRSLKPRKLLENV